MSRRAVLGLVLAGGAGLAGAQQTGAFSSVTGDRGFDVQTASDQNALLGIRPLDPTGSDGDEVEIFKLTNRFSDVLEVTYDIEVVSSGPLELDGNSPPNVAISPGGNVNVTDKLSCDTAVTGDVKINLTASTDNESVQLSRKTTVTCQPATCLSGPKITEHCNEIPCIGIDESGNTDVTVNLIDVTVNGGISVVSKGGGKSKIHIISSTIEEDVTIDIRGTGKKPANVTIKNTTIKGKLTIDIGGGSDLSLDDNDINTVEVSGKDDAEIGKGNGDSSDDCSNDSDDD